MDLTGHINDLIIAAKSAKTNPNANKQWLNKTIARLEEAELFSTKAFDGRVTGVPSNQQAIRGDQVAGCTCPDGAIAQNCPIHA